MVLHKPSGQAVVFLRQPDGSRRMVYLGPHESAVAERRYREALAEHLAGKMVSTKNRDQRQASEWPTVGQLAAAFLVHCRNYYVDADGKRTRGVEHFTAAMEPLLKLLRDVPTERLTIADLIAVRQLLVDGKRCNRNTINAKMRYIRQCVRWGVEQRLVPGSVWHEVSAMKGLPPGRAGVRESKEVEAVPKKWVDAVVPLLPKPLAAAVQLQWWCGARPSEILQLTRSRIAFGGDCWEFRPPAHKGRWKGKERVIRLGPEAQRLLAPLLKLEPNAAILSPRDAVRELHEGRTRESKETPSQRKRRERRARKPPTVGEFYGIDSYRKAIHRACDEAGFPRWSPHRLRHAAGTRIYLATRSIEDSRAALGHADSRVTRRYAVAADSEIAAAVMGQHG